MVIKSQRLPLPGETLLGGSFLMNAGGKGANQAVAASRLGAEVTFVGSLGQDIFGDDAFKMLSEAGLDTSHINRVSNIPTGTAIITIDAKGENTIIVAPGANFHLTESQILNALRKLPSASLVLLQLEIPMELASFAIKKASELNHLVILNPAPYLLFNDSLYADLFMITPNQTEAEQLTGIIVIDETSAQAAANILHEKGVNNVIITMGSKGAYISTNNLKQLVPAPKVENVIDTTGAGDCFNGVLAVGLLQGKTIDEATDLACRAAAIAVTRMGAQSSMPTLKEINETKT